MRATGGAGPTRAGVALELGRAAYGLGSLLAPERAAAGELRGAPAQGTTKVARLLGARHLLQAVAVLTTGSATAHRVGAVVDGLHGLTMVPWAALTRTDRRYYVTSAVVATSLATLEWRVSRRQKPAQPM